MDMIYVKGKFSKSELIMTVLVPLLLGFLAYLIVEKHTSVYFSVAESRIFPPLFIFLPIWTLILTAKGIASYRMKLAAPNSYSHSCYAASLLLAFAWNVALFRFGGLTVAFVLILLYLFFIFLTFFEFEKEDKLAGYMVIPAFCWGIVLAVINFLICKGHGIV